MNLYKIRENIQHARITSKKSMDSKSQYELGYRAGLDDCEADIQELIEKIEKNIKMREKINENKINFDPVKINLESILGKQGVKK